MSRSCPCARILAALQGDPRLRTLPLATRALFLLLAQAALATGGVIPFAETTRLSLLVSAPETEVETHLETLLAEALVARAGPGLAIPLLEAAPVRPRQGPQTGGRPRKGETPEDAYRRRQSAMLLPVQGGAPAKPETAAKPPAETLSLDDRKIQSISSSSLTPAARGAAAEALMARVMAIAGVDPARKPWFAHEASAWITAGASAELVAEVVAEVMANRVHPGPPDSPRYFTRAITAAIEAGRQPAPVAAPDAPVPPVVAWARACDAARAEGRPVPRPAAFGLGEAA